MKNIIKNLEDNASKLKKEEILHNEWISNNMIFFEGLKYCYDPMITYGVKSVPLIKESTDEFETEFTWSEFKELLNKLSKRELTGHAAKDEILNFIEKCSTDDWNYFYRRILIKDMKCGVKETTINNVLKKISKTDKRALNYIIPTFDIQLADTVDENEIKGIKLVDTKYDGIRAVCILNKSNNTVTFYSRNGKLLENFSELENSLKILLNNLPGSLVLDGEIMSNSFNELMKQVHRKTDIQTNDSTYKIFDIINFDEFTSKKCQSTLSERHKILCNLEPIFQSLNLKNLEIVPKVEINFSTPEGFKKYKDLFNESTQIENGKKRFEGLMVKDPNSLYEFKRSKAWVKIKPNIEVTLKIVGFEEGEKGKKREGTLGAIVCEGIEDNKHIKVNVSSGFTEQQLNEIWENKETILNQLVEIKADEITKSEDNDHYSLRFPVFIRFRTFNNNEKL